MNANAWVGLAMVVIACLVISSPAVVPLFLAWRRAVRREDALEDTWRTWNRERTAR